MLAGTHLLQSLFDALFFHSEAANLVAAAQDKLVDYTHPDPYCQPYMPGGSKFMRNPPPPTEVCQSFLKNRCAAEESGEEGAPSVGDGLG
jgi:hypothetical protein